MSLFKIKSMEKMPPDRAREIAAMTIEHAVVTDHTIKGLPVIFNPTAPQGCVLNIGEESDLCLTAGHELHCRESDYAKYLADPLVRQLVHHTIQIIEEGLRKERRRSGH